MYVPLIKNRQSEMKAVRDTVECFSEKILPLFEIIEDKYEKRFKLDATTGEIVREKQVYKNGKVVYRKVQDDPREEDIITLYELHQILGNKQAMIDFFRFDMSEYAFKLDMSKLELSRKLMDVDYYLERLKQCCEYNNFIPVVSVKRLYELSEEALAEFIQYVHKKGKQFALRVEASLLDRYQDIIENELAEGDYVLLDIKHNPINAKSMELLDLQCYATLATKILLNSPREATLYNTQFEESGFTDMINNEARDRYLEFDLDGYGDYVGQADKLPQHGHGNSGSAIALMYCYEENQFKIFRNTDSSLGANGYIKVYEDVLNDEKNLNSNGMCRAYRILNENRQSIRDWKFWIRIGMVRYIDQMKQYM